MPVESLRLREVVAGREEENEAGILSPSQSQLGLTLLELKFGTRQSRDN